jgi:hypothetical protein
MDTIPMRVPKYDPVILDCYTGPLWWRRIKFCFMIVQAIVMVIYALAAVLVALIFIGAILYVIVTMMFS